jgi:hypothetical protein
MTGPEAIVDAQPTAPDSNSRARICIAETAGIVVWCDKSNAKEKKHTAGKQNQSR